MNSLRIIVFLALFPTISDMFKSFRIIAVLALMIGSLGSTFAGEMPYTDVATNAPYASAVQELYDGRVITDDGSHLFRPTDLMARDFFVSLAVGIGCKICMTPSVDDIIRYQVSPFVDLPKTNPYYYCIAYAKESNIALGYIPDTTGMATCEDNHPYTSSPFCAGNSISRIEAAAILLRRAHLWDDTLNSGIFDHTISIPDTTSYWYGYAKKSLEIGIIFQKTDGKVGQDEKITRGEFAMMAARILKYTQCQPIKTQYSTSSEIIIRDSINKVIQKSIFPQGYTGSLAINVGSGLSSANWDKRWHLRNPITGEVLAGDGDTYPLSGLSCGTWINTVDLIDRASSKVVSSASNTITIECQEQKIHPPLSVSISADPLDIHLGQSTQFGSTITGGSGTIGYHWDFGDGTMSTSSNNPSHIYKENGVYTVSLVITDANGNTALSELIVVVSGDKDTDRDGVPDKNDQCPLVYAQTSSGCPTIETYKLPFRFDKLENNTKNNDKNIAGSTNSIWNNICLYNKAQSRGLLIGAPNCSQCPCNNTIDINSALRSCDVVFPTILSPTMDSVYSRGNFYLIP